MRAVTLPIVLLAIAAPAHAAGAYASFTARDAAACARLCADDGLCIAWAMSPNGTCELRATAPSEPLSGAYGYSTRAPENLRQSLVNELRAPVVEAPPAPEPIIVAEEAAAIADPLRLSEMLTEDDMTLLGGPEPSTETTALRPRLGARY